MNENYHLPANYTDAGKLLGMFEIRNAVEAVVLAVPRVLLGHSPLLLTVWSASTPAPVAVTTSVTVGEAI